MARTGLLRLWLAIVVSFASRVLDLLIPPRCAGCGERESWLCPTCAAGLPRPEGRRCRVCALALRGDVQVCADCYRDPPPIERVRAAFRHEGLARQLVLDLKYRRQRHLAPTLGGLLAAAAPRDVDAVVPIPLHPARRRERGFNQSELLAVELGRRLRRPVVGETVRRTRDTAQQTGLSPRERLANVRGAFAVDGRLDGGRLLLVDDVCTTGATLYACAGALRAAGAASVVAAVFTRASYGVIEP
jgi:ComF family protein